METRSPCSKDIYGNIIARKDGNSKNNLQIDNQEIFETKASKFPGVFIDNRFNWKIHLAYISEKIIRGMPEDISTMTACAAIIYGVTLMSKGYRNCKCCRIKQFGLQQGLIPELKLNCFITTLVYLT